MHRFNTQQVATWRREGGVLIENFFTASEIDAVRADFEKVFARQEGGEQALNTKKAGEIGRFDGAQFATFEAIPFSGAHALNLIGVHPQLIEFARAALAVNNVHLYQCQAWAKFTGDADYDQPFHCDFVNHTLTVPSDKPEHNSVTIICYFTDVTEAHGPMHYVKRTDSDPLGGAAMTLSGGQALQEALRPFEQTSAAPAGTIFPYGIDVFHRGTNMTAPGGVRYAVMACFKKAGDESIGYHAWPFHHLKPWNELFARATPDQLSCFGVHPPGHAFWNDVTLAHAQQRYPDWDMTPYREALT
ncbi:MAG: phytanoyl-CoA dioxygenase family protein [bacterium]